MIRLIPVLLAVVVLGCQGQESHVPMDPFYGQTKIPPPGTGEIARRPSVDPYYPRAAAATPGYGAQVSLPDVGHEAKPSGTAPTQLASSSLSGQESAAAKRGDRIEIPLSARRELSPSELLAAKSAANPRGEGSPTPASPRREPERFDQTLPPRERSVAGQSSQYSRPSAGSNQVTPRGAPVDINYLPPANRGAGTLRDDRVQQASANELEGGTAVRIPTQVDDGVARGRYGWSDDYTRLRGRLEYIEREGCWKLRYIPVDHKTDDYGGSVVIADTSILSGYERGDFVEVRGRIAGRSEDAKDFAPSFEVANIRKF